MPHARCGMWDHLQLPTLTATGLGLQKDVSQADTSSPWCASCCQSEEAAGVRDIELQGGTAAFFQTC